MSVTRRALLSTAGLAALGTVPLASAPAYSAVRSRPGDPFELGVASGDPWPDGMVLWTRLAPRPLAEDGFGGMPGRTVKVEWQLAEDARFRRTVKSGSVETGESQGFSVHVEVRGLQPGREYFYRFRTGGHLSPTGRTRTTPAPGSMTPLAFATASCSHYEHGYFTAYRRLAEQDPDLVVHLGDYMYEYAPGSYKGANGKIRRHTDGKCQSLTDYRRRHAQYKSDPDLQLAHAAAPWAVIWDDHEIEDNWAGKNAGTKAPGFNARKRNGMRAYYENMPLRRSSLPRGTQIQLYRRLHWGSLASFHLLDTRQYRSDQPCDDWVRTDCDARLDQRRSVVGGEQLRWLDAGLRGSARWDVLAQQIFLGQRDFMLGPATEMIMDAWDGYAAERDRLFSTLLRSGARNPVVLTGDVHTAYAGDLVRNFDDPASARVGIELVSTSIASDGDGYHDEVGLATQLSENEHLVHVDQRRGFMICRLSAEALVADFHTLPYISKPNAPASRTARFTAPDGARSLAR